MNKNMVIGSLVLVIAACIFTLEGNRRLLHPADPLRNWEFRCLLRGHVVLANEIGPGLQCVAP